MFTLLGQNRFLHTTKHFLSKEQTEERSDVLHLRTHQASTLSHWDQNTAQPSMVDISHKKVSVRTAHAIARIKLPESIWKILDPSGEIRSPKGAVFTTAIVAGVQGAKSTAQLIPFCHPLPLEDCSIRVVLPNARVPNSCNNPKIDVLTGQTKERTNELDNDCVEIHCYVKTSHKTGVEMEALTGVSVAALTIYDMCKAVSKGILIEKIELLEKSGGKSDYVADSLKQAG